MIGLKKLFEKLAFFNGAFHHNKKNRDGNQADGSSTINDYRNASVYQPQPVVLQVPLLKDQASLWFENQFPQPNPYETSSVFQEDYCELKARFIDWVQSNYETLPGNKVLYKKYKELKKKYMKNNYNEAN